MREIKFRAWDNNNDFMFYHNDEGEFSRIIDGERVGSDFDIKDLLFSPYDGILSMQFTGLTDKNGKEIYESDVYHQGDPNITYTVVYKGSTFIGKQNGSSSYAGLEYWQDRIEVIGNIHENPELL